MRRFVTLHVQEAEADDLDLALVKRNESVTDEEEVIAALFQSQRDLCARFTFLFALKGMKILN